MLDACNHVPLYIQLKNEIEENIKNAVWKIDCRIPTETELMGIYHVGRATVREAVSLLVNEGYLLIKKGIGTFVIRRQPSLGFEPLISLDYTLKAKGIEPVNVVKSQETLVPDNPLTATLKWKKRQRCFCFVRHRFVNGQTVAIEKSYFKDSYREILSQYDLTGSIARILLEQMNISVKKIEQVVVPREATVTEQDTFHFDCPTNVINLERWIYVEGSEEPFFYVNFIAPDNIYNSSFF